MDHTRRRVAQSILSRAVWRKSSRSTAGGECVEIAFVGPAVAVRDSKDPRGPVLLFDAAVWTGFLDGVRSGEFGGAAVRS